jgi:hypothetical protein
MQSVPGLFSAIGKIPDELEMEGRGVCVLIEILSQHWSEETEESHEHL